MSDKASDLDELGQFLEEHRKFLAPTVAAYALTPLPTNNLFIAAGMVEVNVAWVLAGFWVARIFADTLWVWTTNAAFENLGELFESAVTGPAAFALQLAGVVSIFLLYRLPWARWLRNVTSDSNAA